MDIMPGQKLTLFPHFSREFIEIDYATTSNLNWLNQDLRLKITVYKENKVLRLI